MKTIARGLAVWLAAVALAPAETAVPAAAAAGRAFSLGGHVAYWDLSRLEGIDVNGATGAGIVGQFSHTEHFAWELRMSGFAAGDERTFVAEDGRRYENDVTIVSMLLEANVLFRLPLGRTFSLYGGPGGGYYLFDGQSNSDLGDKTILYDIEVDDEFGWYALVGLRAQPTPRFGLYLEGKYTWIETSIEKAVEVRREIGIDWVAQDLDFSGFALHAGLIFTF
ncbi:MAG: outer membrane beta-barrel protein [Kiritimatiellia bacterium]